MIMIRSTIKVINVQHGKGKAKSINAETMKKYGNLENSSCNPIK